MNIDEWINSWMNRLTDEWKDNNYYWMDKWTD